MKTPIEVIAWRTYWTLVALTFVGFAVGGPNSFQPWGQALLDVCFDVTLILVAFFITFAIVRAIWWSDDE